LNACKPLSADRSNEDALRQAVIPHKSRESFHIRAGISIHRGIRLC
jgi:hypothetical protein